MFKVLVVDDHPVMVMAITMVLEQDPMIKVIGSSGDGNDALALYRRHRDELDLLIVDIELAGLNGLDLIERIRTSDRDVRILVMSSQPGELVAARCRALGANGYVEKSNDASHILNGAKAVLSGFSCFPEAIANTAPDDAAGSPLAQLSEREQVIFRYLAKGCSNKEIAEILSLSGKTVSTHKTNILGKLGVKSVVDLAALARSHRLI
ncbi:response regulator transcription factor [Burkholderia sp. GS2Y]|uniref:Response regulator transcription factor n=1 Tax=Burkholderia theae TaxID=3143496 RepID=A0ABU9WTR0_9BURK